MSVVAMIVRKFGMCSVSPVGKSSRQPLMLERCDSVSLSLSLPPSLRPSPTSLPPSLPPSLPLSLLASWGFLALKSLA
jgi:hypothetical protein